MEEKETGDTSIKALRCMLKNRIKRLYKYIYKICDYNKKRAYKSDILAYLCKSEHLLSGVDYL